MKEKILAYIEKWERQGYSDGIPDEAPERLHQLGKVPSYKAICLAIIKNDHSLQTLGYSRIKSPVYSEIKRHELICRGVIKPDFQLKLFY